TRVLVTQRTDAWHPQEAAAWRALLTSTWQICSCTASEGERQEYWIWLNRGGRLSDVASPPARMNSFSVQAPACGYIASLVYFVVVYIRQSASIAPGQRATACAEVRMGSSDLSIQRSGARVSKVMTTLQYAPHCVSPCTVFMVWG